MAETDGIKNAENAAERSSEKLRRDISEKMESLSKTVDQIGSRVHETFDWREQVGRHPYIALGAAAGLGFLLSGLFKPSPSPAERMMDAIGETVEDIGDALHASLKEGMPDKTAAPGFIAIVGTLILKTGIEFLLARAVKEKPMHSMPTNGKPSPSSGTTIQQTQATQ